MGITMISDVIRSCILLPYSEVSRLPYTHKCCRLD